MAKLPVGHISMVPNDFSDMFWGHVFLLSIHKSKLPLFGIALGLQLLPFPGYKDTLVKDCTPTAPSCPLLTLE